MTMELKKKQSWKDQKASIPMFYFFGLKGKYILLLPNFWLIFW
jgi:hypothetical protein